jgi:hypothetical protein
VGSLSVALLTGKKSHAVGSLSLSKQVKKSHAVGSLFLALLTSKKISRCGLFISCPFVKDV